jgi:hypothetical protein
MIPQDYAKGCACPSAPGRTGEVAKTCPVDWLMRASVRLTRSAPGSAAGRTWSKPKTRRTACKCCAPPACAYPCTGAPGAETASFRRRSIALRSSELSLSFICSPVLSILCPAQFQKTACLKPKRSSREVGATLISSTKPIGPGSPFSIYRQKMRLRRANAISPSPRGCPKSH